MLIPRFKEEKEPQYDLKAGRQIFDVEHTRDDKKSYSVADIPKDSENPIDITLRRLAISSLDGFVNLKQEFFDKWAVIVHGENPTKMVIGRIKDLFVHTRDVYIKTRKGHVYIVPFDKVISVSEREP